MYKTRDIFLAAYLMTLGYQVEKFEKNGRLIDVVFEEDNCEKDALDYYNGAECEARKFADCYKNLKEVVLKGRDSLKKET